jgi:hypothetical protein
MKATELNLGHIVGQLVSSDDVADTLAGIVRACCELYPSDSVAILLRTPDGALDLLSSSSHHVDALELLQIQSHHGPCVECLSTNETVTATSQDELVQRWKDVGEAIVSAGFDGAHAFPMHWHGEAIGGLNIFVQGDTPPNLEVGQLIADLATLAVLRTGELSTAQIISRMHDAMAARALIEQAKGALAVLENTDLDGAYTRLMARTESTGRGLTDTAMEVIRQAHETS